MNNLKTLLNSQDENICENTLNEAVSQMLDNSLKTELRNAIPKKQVKINDNTNQLKIRRLIKRSILAIAACLVLVLSYKYFIDQPSLENLSNQYASSDIVKHPGLTKGENDFSNFDAIKAFNKEDWKQASQLFNDLNPSLENQYYEGISSFYNNDYSNVISILNQEQFTSSIYSQEVKWFLAMAYLQSKDIGNGLQTLKSISKKEWKYEESRILIKAIESSN